MYALYIKCVYTNKSKQHIFHDINRCQCCLVQVSRHVTLICILTDLFHCLKVHFVILETTSSYDGYYIKYQIGKTSATYYTRNIYY